MEANEKRDVFISFDFSDQDKVRYITERLETKHGISCWICLKDVSGGQNFKNEIMAAIENSNVLVVFLSKDSIESTEVPKEVGLALAKEKTVIPFKLDEISNLGNLAYDLTNTDYIDATIPTFDERIDELGDAIFKASSTAIDLADPKSGASRSKKKLIEIGDIVRFGSYPQDYGVSIKKPVEWRVIDRKNDKLLLLSRYILDGKPYNLERIPTTWESSTLRKWLNAEFLNNAFTDAERARISDTDVAADRVYKSKADPGKDTCDKIFLLSISDVTAPILGILGRFLSKDRRVAIGTGYAKEKGMVVAENGGSPWWLRSTGIDNCSACYVLFDGIVTVSTKVDYDCGGVRPAMWINMFDV